MTQLRGLENTHHERLTERGLELLEHAVKTSLEETIPEECRTVSTLFSPKSCVQYANTCLSDLVSKHVFENILKIGLRFCVYRIPCASLTSCL